MLPSHGQDTAAVELSSHWAGRTPYVYCPGGDVFGKQAKLKFAEFLLPY